MKFKRYIKHYIQHYFVMSLECYDKFDSCKLVLKHQQMDRVNKAKSQLTKTILFLSMEEKNKRFINCKLYVIFERDSNREEISFLTNKPCACGGTCSFLNYQVKNIVDLKIKRENHYPWSLDLHFIWNTYFSIIFFILKLLTIASIFK